MAIRLGSVVVNVADMELMTAFWAAALGHTPPSYSAPGDDFRVLQGERVNLSLQRAHSPVTARDQMHLDLYTEAQAAEVDHTFFKVGSWPKNPLARRCPVRGQIAAP